MAARNHDGVFRCRRYYRTARNSQTERVKIVLIAPFGLNSKKEIVFGT